VVFNSLQLGEKGEFCLQLLLCHLDFGLQLGMFNGDYQITLSSGDLSRRKTAWLPSQKLHSRQSQILTKQTWIS